jgi:TPR repeat protein
MNLGRLYRDGRGVRRDLVEAYKWLYVASRNGELHARHYLQELEFKKSSQANLMTQEEIAEARRRGDELSASLHKRSK